MERKGADMVHTSEKITIVPGSRIALPVGVTGFTAYTVDGNALYTFCRSDATSAASAELPMDQNHAALAVQVTYEYNYEVK